jgi:hypothetical protein
VILVHLLVNSSGWIIEMHGATVKIIYLLFHLKYLLVRLGERGQPWLTPLLISANLNVVQTKHNNIFNNVNFSTCFGYRNHHQADISVQGHDTFSAYNRPMGSHIVYICCVEFQTFRLINYSVYCKHWTWHVSVMKCLPDGGYRNRNM